MRTMSFSRLDICDIPLYRFSALDNAGLLHAVTTRHGRGETPFDLSFVASDSPRQVLADRKLLCDALGVPLSALTVCRQVHGARVAHVDAENRGCGAASPDTAIADCDAMISNESGAALMVLCADCPVTALWDPRNRALGLAHCGWRGVVGGIVADTIAAMARRFGTKPGDLIACCGPSVGPCCYEVSADVADEFATRFPDGGCVIDDGARLALDLRAAVRTALMDCGVSPKKIEISGVCTKCHNDEFFSYRAEGEGAGRFAFVAVVP